MTDYSKSKIYKILNTEDDEVYIGSTVEALSQRMARHRGNHKRGCQQRLYQHMGLHGADCFFIELLENFPCNSIEELRAKEGEWIRRMGTLNKNIAGRTRNEYMEDNRDRFKERRGEYYERNKDAILGQVHAYYEENKDHIKGQKKEYYARFKSQIAEKHSAYYERNKDDFVHRNKQHYEQNKEYISRKHKEKITCECGVIHTRGYNARHLKSQKHQNYVTGKDVPAETGEIEIK